MAIASAQPNVSEHSDRRVVRSRQMLVDALGRLLRRRDFDVISVQEIADEADLTRRPSTFTSRTRPPCCKTMIAARFGEMLRNKAPLASPMRQA